MDGVLCLCMNNILFFLSIWLIVFFLGYYIIVSYECVLFFMFVCLNYDC